MNLLMKFVILPIDNPRILLAPDSLGSTTFLAFYSENALFSSKILFFLISYSALVSLVLNLPINSPIRSVAPSGGFSTSFFFLFFLFLSSFDSFTSLYYFTSETEIYEGFTDGWITDEEGVWDWDCWLLIDWLFELEDGCCWDVELLREEVSFHFDLSLIDEFDGSSV